MAYFAAAQVRAVGPDPRSPDHAYACIDPRTYLEFPTTVPYRADALFMESALRNPDGSVNRGAFRWAVREIPDAEFAAIVAMGLAGVRDDLGREDWTPEPAPPGPGRRIGGLFADPAAGVDAAPPGMAAPDALFERPLVERLTARPLRDAAFARQVKRAYRETCAMTGLRILNGGGRPEVQAAHIRSVEAQGPDTVRNGVALSGTAHWMFDRGLVSINDDHSILVAKDRLPPGAEALLRPERRLLLPEDAASRPHPAYLKWHRDTVFKG
ncbi:HNH endonuclease [Albimonas sp. CAU 1670]|uniref:HNH endonuclease n=1 Tax=Albimonas sp. CAU 1670 TaxID=3032599 RepID=UPI0023DBF038|nr:HNH endonuclease [Albimonas sp. CAU 1670]MDF2232126.1 HNH endonuclease [Albimonas sp. CAU 1670]